ncbi:unnamed protein product [Urochloa humidicola]
MARSAVFILAMAVVAAGLQTAISTPPPPPPGTGAPATCSSALSKLFECLPFLSLTTAISGPTAACCSALRANVASPDSICLCHLIGGEIGEMTHTTINPMRLALLPFVCLAIVPPTLPAMCLVGPVPPIHTPPDPAPPANTPPAPAPPAN